MHPPPSLLPVSDAALVTLLNATELSALTGITRRAIIHASTRGNAYFRAWSYSEAKAWDFIVLNPGSKKLRKGFYRVP